MKKNAVNEGETMNMTLEQALERVGGRDVVVAALLNRWKEEGREFHSQAEQNTAVDEPMREVDRLLEIVAPNTV